MMSSFVDVFVSIFVYVFVSSLVSSFVSRFVSVVLRGTLIFVSAGGLEAQVGAVLSGYLGVQPVWAEEVDSVEAPQVDPRGDGPVDSEPDSAPEPVSDVVPSPGLDSKPNERGAVGAGAADSGEARPVPVEPSSLLKDVTGDGAVTYLGFGDSITYGVGDGSRPGEVSSSLPRTDGSLGYNRRLSQLLGIPAINAGVSGEELDGDGIRRLPQVVGSSGADIVGIFEGINDARQQLSVEAYQRLIQKSVNMVRALGRTPVLFTQVNPCCDHLLPDGSPDAYSQAIRQVGQANGVAVADVFKAWSLICPPGVVCSLVNLPEGLHPNTKGYSVIAQVATAAILGTDIFTPEGAKQFLEATGLREDQLLNEIEIR